MGHLAKKEVQMARTSLNKAVKLNPELHRAKIVLADIALKQRDMREAEKMSKAVLAVLPDNYEAKSILGRVYMTKQQLDSAQSEFEGMISLQPKNPKGYFQLGLLHKMKKDNKSAMESFEKALAINPKLFDVFGHIVSIHTARKEYDTALAKCETQLVAYKDNAVLQAVVLNLKGGVLSTQKKDDEAEKAFKSAIKANADYAQPYYGLARMYLKKKDQERPFLNIKHYWLKIRIRPNPI
jgi:Tfp pilus assembly protein PilF